MSGQRFVASTIDTFTWANGAIGHRPGHPMDCLGPFAKVRNCPIDGTDLRRTCYATAYPDTYFSVPARTQVKGRTIKGFFTSHEDGLVFVSYSQYDEFLGIKPKAEKA